MSRKERIGAKLYACVTVLAGTHKYTLNNFLKSSCCLVFFLSSVKENKTASLHKHSSCIKTIGFFFNASESVEPFIAPLVLNLTLNE